MFTCGVVLTFSGTGIHFGKRESHISCFSVWWCCKLTGEIIGGRWIPSCMHFEHFDHL